MAILDVQIVSAALPRIATALHTPLDRLSWVQTAYLVTEVIAIAVSGRLARAMSTRVLFAGAAAGFAATSFGCALSPTFEVLIVWRTLQGVFAGAIIPTVFAGGYKMFPKELHARAVLLGGAVAVLAPSVGPCLGGWIAQGLSWNWLFLINVPIGLAIAAVVFNRVHVDEPDPAAWRRVDVVAFAALSVGLGALQVLMKVAPPDRWTSPRDVALGAVTVAALGLFVWRCARAVDPLVDLAPLRSVPFTVACVDNFLLGVAYFGSLYVLPVFLGFVRFHTPLEIGVIMTVAGAAQLAVAPFATIAERRLPASWMVGVGFALFAVGCVLNASENPRTDFGGLVVPQILRGAAVLLCILPITNVALEDLPAEMLSNASAVLNLLRNVGGAIGIGLVDTILNVRPHPVAERLLAQLRHGDAAAAAFVGIPRDMLAGTNAASADPGDVAFLTPIIERAAVTVACNEAWIAIACAVALSLVVARFLRSEPAAIPASLERSVS